MSTTTVVCERNNNAGDAMEIQQGSFVEIRGRQWLVEAVDDTQPDLTTLRLSCIADDAQGEQIEVLWDAEIGAKVIQDDTWSQVGRGAPDSPEVLAAYLRAIRWRSATAADRDLLQAPFRAGIRLDHYQLLPLRKALRLPWRAIFNAKRPWFPQVNGAFFVDGKLMVEHKCCPQSARNHP
jgi:hypothetical protein